MTEDATSVQHSSAESLDENIDIPRSRSAGVGGLDFVGRCDPVDAPGIRDTHVEDA